MIKESQVSVLVYRALLARIEIQKEFLLPCKTWTVTQFIFKLIRCSFHNANLVFGYMSLEKFQKSDTQLPQLHPQVYQLYLEMINHKFNWSPAHTNAVTCEYNAL